MHRGWREHRWRVGRRFRLIRWLCSIRLGFTSCSPTSRPPAIYVLQRIGDHRAFGGGEADKRDERAMLLRRQWRRPLCEIHRRAVTSNRPVRSNFGADVLTAVAIGGCAGMHARHRAEESIGGWPGGRSDGGKPPWRPRAALLCCAWPCLARRRMAASFPNSRSGRGDRRSTSCRSPAFSIA